MKPLPQSRVALALLNREADRTATAATITVELSDLSGLGMHGPAVAVESVWDATTDVVGDGRITRDVPPLGVALLVLSPAHVLY